MNTNTEETPKAKAEREHNELRIAAGKSYAFPKAKAFNDLFTEAKPWDYDQGRYGNFPAIIREQHTWDDKPVKSEIGSHCSISGESYRSLSVRPSAKVAEWISSNMLAIEHDQISFGIVDHCNGKSLVVAHYSQIIGSRWLAYIDTETIP